jgi:hypothetical protein
VNPGSRNVRSHGFVISSAHVHIYSCKKTVCAYVTLTQHYRVYIGLSLLTVELLVLLIFTHVHTHTLTRAHTHTHTHTQQIHTHIRTHTRIHANTHTHTQRTDTHNMFTHRLVLRAHLVRLVFRDTEAFREHRACRVSAKLALRYVSHSNCLGCAFCSLPISSQRLFFSAVCINNSSGVTYAYAITSTRDVLKRVSFYATYRRYTHVTSTTV